MRLAAAITLIAASASAMSPGSVDYAARWIGENIAATSTDPNLVGWWRWEESSIDEINGLQASQVGSGLSYTNDATEGSFASFWTPNTYLIATNTLISDYPFTIMAWVWRGVAANHAILSLSPEGSSAEAFSLYIASNNRLTAYSDNSTASSDQITSPLVTTGTWHHVAAVWESITNKLIYLNGVLGIQVTSARDPFSVASGGVSDMTRLGIGTFRAVSPTFYFAGKMDDLRLYDRVVTSNEIYQMYLDGLP